jgi:hypothetical protein
MLFVENEIAEKTWKFMVSFENTSYSAMLSIMELVPPPESVQIP